MFGTGEANTDMIRGENTVTDVVNLCRDSSGGNLTTINILTGNVDRRGTDGRFNSTIIPAWVEQQHIADTKSLWWLCMKLGYRFFFNYADIVSISAFTSSLCGVLTLHRTLL